MHRVRKVVADLLPPAPPPHVGPDATVVDAADAMRGARVHAVVIVDEDAAPIGIFTERDLLVRVYARGLDPAATPVTEAMTPEPVTLPLDACITYAINRMGLDGLSNLPIVDPTGRLAGLIGVEEVVRHLDEVFTDLESDVPTDDADSPWIDIGGGA